MLNSRQLIAGALLAAALCPAAPTTPPPHFDEVYRLLSTNLDGVSPDQLDRAAVQGLISQLGPSVRLIDPPGAEAAEQVNPAALADSRVFDNAFAYFRIGTVNSNLPDAFLTAYHEMTRTNQGKIKGIVLDLRFASGGDYGAAAKLADCFLNSDRPLLNWQSGAAHASRKADAILLPVAVLINSRTGGAAEALAAVLRQTGVGLLLGATTAGRASIFKEFPLSNGGELRVAVATVTVGDGKSLTNGLAPDITVDTALPDEETWLNDPYKVLHPPEIEQTDNTNIVAEPPHPRFNETELIREHAAGEDEEDDSDSTGPITAGPGPPLVADPVLARALDLLKGLAVIEPSRPG